MRKTRLIILVGVVMIGVSLMGTLLARKQLDSAAFLQIDRELSSLAADAYKTEYREWVGGDYYISIMSKEGKREDVTKTERKDQPPYPKGSTVLNPALVKSESGREWRAGISANYKGEVILVAVDAQGAREITREGWLVSSAVMIANTLGVIVICCLALLRKRTPDTLDDVS